MTNFMVYRSFICEEEIQYHVFIERSHSCSLVYYWLTAWRIYFLPIILVIIRITASSLPTMQRTYSTSNVYYNIRGDSIRGYNLQQMIDPNMYDCLLLYQNLRIQPNLISDTTARLHGLGHSVFKVIHMQNKSRYRLHFGQNPAGKINYL